MAVADVDVTLEPVSTANWERCAALTVHTDQQGFVSPVAWYLALCTYGCAGWKPLAVVNRGTIVGFVMHAVDPEDDSFWIGGLLIDASQQRLGFGTAVVRELIERARSGGRSGVALTYEPSNVAAQRCYARLGFVESGERDDNEVVARLRF